MTDHFADRLLAACDRKGAPICVGIDPVFERLPAALRSTAPAESAPPSAALRVETIDRFVRGVLEAVQPFAPCVKFQSACFERYGWLGTGACDRLMHHAAQLGFVVIFDAKRGDIGISAEHYAAGNLAPGHFAENTKSPGPDSLTLNSYLGDDSLAPFINTAAAHHKGLFVLVRTSNPGSDALQTLTLTDGRTVSDAVADMVARLGSAPGMVGASGYSLLGAVVGATKPQDAQRLRHRMPQQIFLVPGFGAQGGGADDVKACFNKDRRGALITASRSVLFAYEKSPAPDWKLAIANAAKDMRTQIQTILQ